MNVIFLLSVHQHSVVCVVTVVLTRVRSHTSVRSVDNSTLTASACETICTSTTTLSPSCVICVATPVDARTTYRSDGFTNGYGLLFVLFITHIASFVSSL